MSDKAVSKNSIQTGDNAALMNFDQMLESARSLIDNKLVPKSFKTEQQVITAIQYGKQLDMHPVVAVNSFDVIEGNVSMKAKIIPGMLAKRGVAVKVIKDYAPVYSDYPVYEKDDEGNVLKDENGLPVPKRDHEGNPVYKDVVDRVTILRFIRHFEGIGVVENDIEFYWSDAVKAGWTGKANWKKMPRFMMLARCMSRGARIAASDLMMGLYDTYEIAEFAAPDFDVTEDGEVIINDPADQYK